MCSNVTEFYVWRDELQDCILVPVKCGHTDPWGDLCLCDKCEFKRETIETRREYCTSLGFDM